MGCDVRTGFRGPPLGALKAVLHVIEDNTIHYIRTEDNTK